MLLSKYVYPGVDFTAYYFIAEFCVFSAYQDNNMNLTRSFVLGRVGVNVMA